MAVSLSHVRFFFSIPMTPILDVSFEKLEKKLKKAFPQKSPQYFHELEYDEENILLVLEAMKNPSEQQIKNIWMIINRIVEEL